MNTDPGSEKIIFGHMHEDASTERDIFRYLAGENQVESALVVCSGGEIAASLLAEGVRKLDVIDVNQSQLDLCRLKIQICREFEPEVAEMIITRECSLAHINAIKDHRTKRFAETHTSLLRRGICFSGKTERSLYVINRYIRPMLLPDNVLKNPGLRFSTVKVMVSLFARMLHGNIPLPDGWAARILERLTSYLNQHGFNDALTQSLLRSRFPERAITPWQRDTIDKIRMNGETEINYIHKDLTPYLTTHNSKYQFMALSNVCDMLTKQDRDMLLQLALARLTQRGILVVRSMFLRAEDFSILNNVETMAPAIKLIADKLIAEQDRSILCPPVVIFQNV